MEQQLMMEHNAFAKKPFYKWFTRKCSECEKRSLWSPMVKCKCCKTYNHRRCKDKHAERMESTTQPGEVSTVEVSMTEDTAASTSGTCEETKSTCSGEVTTKLQVVEEATPAGGTDEFADLDDAAAPDTENAEKVQVQTDEVHCSSRDDAVETGSDSNAVEKMTQWAKYRVTVQANKWGNDETILAAADDARKKQPAQPAAKSCCWLIAQYPKKFWPNHRHFLHSSDCLAFPFPTPSDTAALDAGKGDHQQIAEESNQAAEEKIPAVTTAIPKTTPENQ